MTQFNKLSTSQTQALVNAVQQVQTWCEIYGDCGHFADLCGASPKSIYYVDSKLNIYNLK